MSVNIGDSIAANYLRVGNVMKQYGKPNPTFPTDLDITYGELQPHVNTVSGVLNILKTMKQKGMILYRDPVINQKTVLTLVNDWDQGFKGDMILYDKIATEVKEEYLGQKKVGGW